MKKIIHLTYASPKYLPRISAMGQFDRYVLLTGSIFMWTRNVCSFATLFFKNLAPCAGFNYSLLSVGWFYVNSVPI